MFVRYTHPRATRRLAALAVLALAPTGFVALGAGSPAVAAGPPAQTPAGALAQAQATGNPVEVTAAASSTRTVMANPNGTFTLTETAVPTRKKVGGRWAPLDATLGLHDDGSIGPAVAANDVALSGGGSGPFVTLGRGGRQLALSLPVALPAPSLSGNTATYHDVVSGVDLVVTVDTQGGVSDVLVVKDAAAAASPLVRTFAVSTRARGLTLAADAAGNLSARDGQGHEVLTAPTPLVWDSTSAAIPPARVLAGSGGVAIDAATGAAVTSSPASAGESAHIGKLAVQVSAGRIGLGLPASFAAAARYPMYLDPTLHWGSGGLEDGWGNVQSGSGSGTRYWESTPGGSSSEGNLQSGYVPGGAGAVSRGMVNFAVDTSTLAGATIGSAQLDITETWAYNCTNHVVDLYGPATDLTSSNAYWDYWKNVSLGSLVSSANVAHGYTGCANAVVPFNVLSTIQSDVSGGNKSQTFLLRAHDETDQTAWKRWDPTTAKLSITYDHTPATPASGDMHTSPATTCTGTLTAVGDGNVQLYVTPKDADGTKGDKLSVHFNATYPGGTIADVTLTGVVPGTTSSYTLTKSALDTAANGGLIKVSYKTQITDLDGKVSGWSPVCSFNFDQTSTGQPVVAPVTGAVVAQNTEISVSPPSSGTVPSSYLYQLNTHAPVVVPATSGSATFTIKPSRVTNTLTVTSLSAGANVGQTAYLQFDAQPAAPAADSDMDGDGVADLVTVGAVNGLPAGVWQAGGAGNGQITTVAVNIGANGNGYGQPGGASQDRKPADFTGSQVITGQFSCLGEQDVLSYYPSGVAAGEAVITNALGDGSALSGVSAVPVYAGYLTDMFGDNPIQLGAAGDAAHTDSGCPDLIGTSGDATNGYYLAYYPDAGAPGAYGEVDALDAVSPDGTMDWNAWTIATAQVGAVTDMFLWNTATGALYLWTGLGHTVGGTDLSYTAYTVVSSGWNTGAALTLKAADANHDGTPDLWTVGAGGVTTGYLVTDLAVGTATITGQAAQTLQPAKHSWTLNDQTSGAVVAADTTAGTALDVTGGGNAAWDTGDLYDPDLTFDGTNGYAASTGPVVGAGSFTVSAWVRLAAPSTAYRNAISQEGVHTSLFGLGVNAADQWSFWWHSTDTTSPAINEANSTAAATVGAWTHLAGTYNASNNQLILYVNGALAATATAGTPWTPTGAFAIGRGRAADANAYFFAGSVAAVQEYATALSAAQITAIYDQHTPVAPPSGTIGYQAVAGSAQNTASHTITVPATVAPGSVMLLYATINTVNRLSAPTGWTPINATPAGFPSLSSATWWKVATATDPGSTITVTDGGDQGHGTLNLAAYTGVNTADPINAVAFSYDTTDQLTQTTTPTVVVTGAGAWLVSYWACKSSVVTNWSAPSGPTLRTITNDSGGGHINTLVMDSGATVSTGAAGGYTATSDQPHNSEVAWTIALNPAP